MTGGSAILHHKEVTYSITCSPPDLNLPHQVKKSYEILCSFIKDFYKQLGLNVQFAKDLFSSGLGRYKNFCFSSLEHFDFIINGKKIGGNAQRRRKNLVFQHGSIPQALNFETIERLIKDTSNPKIEAASLDCLLGKPTDFYHLGKALADSFSKVFGITFTEEKLSLEELQAVDSFLEYKYKNKEWNYFKKAKIIAIYEKCKTSLVE
jgi:lipoate-protein ligase A